MKNPIKNPNRIAIYLTAFADILAAVLVIVTDLGYAEAAAVITTVAGINALVIKWLTGWQKMESAEYNARLIEMQAIAMAEQQQGERELVKAAQSPRSRLNLPR